MSDLQIAGMVLMVMGVVEFFVFRLVASSNEAIRKVLPMLLGSAIFSVVLGLVFMFL